jgi:hypothetical protein
VVKTLSRKGKETQKQNILLSFGEVEKEIGAFI